MALQRDSVVSDHLELVHGHEERGAVRRLPVGGKEESRQFGDHGAYFEQIINGNLILLDVSGYDFHLERRFRVNEGSVAQTLRADDIQVLQVRVVHAAIVEACFPVRIADRLRRQNVFWQENAAVPVLRFVFDLQRQLLLACVVVETADEIWHCWIVRETRILKLVGLFAENHEFIVNGVQKVFLNAVDSEAMPRVVRKVGNPVVLDFRKLPHRIGEKAVIQNHAVCFVFAHFLLEKFPHFFFLQRIFCGGGKDEEVRADAQFDVVVDDGRLEREHRSGEDDERQTDAVHERGFLVSSAMAGE